MSNLIPQHDYQLDWFHQREIEREPIEEEDEGDGFPEPCEVARAFSNHIVEQVRNLEANRRHGERRIVDRLSRERRVS